jgi:hypothetical protein
VSEALKGREVRAEKTLSAASRPPKKKEVEEKPAVLGRFSSHLKVLRLPLPDLPPAKLPARCFFSSKTTLRCSQMGIVGMPNVGKSSLFNCLSNTSNAAAENVRLAHPSWCMLSSIRPLKPFFSFRSSPFVRASPSLL